MKNEIKIKMVSAVNEALNFRKSQANNEEILKHITKFVSSEKNKQTKLAMIASVSRALNIADTSKTKLRDKEIIKLTIKELQSILENINKK